MDVNDLVENHLKHGRMLFRLKSILSKYKVTQ